MPAFAGMEIGKGKFECPARIVGCRKAGGGDVVTQAEHPAAELEHTDNGDGIHLHAVVKFVAKPGPHAGAHGEFILVVVGIAEIEAEIRLESGSLLHNEHTGTSAEVIRQRELPTRVPRPAGIKCLLVIAGERNHRCIDVVHRAARIHETVIEQHIPQQSRVEIEVCIGICIGIGFAAGHGRVRYFVDVVELPGEPEAAPVDGVLTEAELGARREVILGVVPPAGQLFQESAADLYFVLHKLRRPRFVVHGADAEGCIVVASDFKPRIEGSRVGAKRNGIEEAAPLVAVVGRGTPTPVEKARHRRVQVPRRGIELGKTRILGAYLIQYSQQKYKEQDRFGKLLHGSCV